MENDELKKWWAEASAQTADWSESDIVEALRGKSISVVDRMKRSLWLEIGFVQLSVIVLAWIAYSIDPGPTRWLMILMLLCYVAIGVYFAVKVRMLVRFDFYRTDLHTNLRDLITNMEAFLRVYRICYRWSFGTFYSLGLFTLFLELGVAKMMNFFSSVPGILFLVGFTSAIVAGIALERCYLNKLYGKHINHLRSLLSELTVDSVNGNEPA